MRPQGQVDCQHSGTEQWDLSQAIAYKGAVVCWIISKHPAIMILVFVVAFRHLEIQGMINLRIKNTQLRTNINETIWNPDLQAFSNREGNQSNAVSDLFFQHLAFFQYLALWVIFSNQVSTSHPALKHKAPGHGPASVRDLDDGRCPLRQSCPFKMRNVNLWVNAIELHEDWLTIPDMVPSKMVERSSLFHGVSNT